MFLLNEQGGCKQPQSPYDPAYQAQQQQKYAIPAGASKRNYDEEARNGFYPGNELSRDSRPPGTAPPPGKVMFTATQEATHARMRGLDCRQAQRPYIPGSIPEGASPHPHYTQGQGQGHHTHAHAHHTQGQGHVHGHHPQNAARIISATNLNYSQVTLTPDQQAKLLQLQQSNQLRKQQLIQQQKEQREELEQELQEFTRLEDDLRKAFMDEEKFRLSQQQLEMQNKYNQNAIQSYTPLPNATGQYLTAPRTQQIAIQSPDFQTYPLQTPYVPPAAYVPNGAHPHFAVSAPRVVCGPPL